VVKKKAFGFEKRENKNQDKLLEMLKSLSIGNMYTDSNYPYYERFSTEVLTLTERNRQKKEISIVEEVECATFKKRHSFFENRTDAQNRCCSDNKCLVLGRLSLILFHIFRSSCFSSHFFELHDL
jgi:IS1 family transposase